MVCDLNGRLLDGPEVVKPSEEIYFHPVYSTAYANLIGELPLSTISVQVKLAHVPCLHTALPGSDEVKERVLETVLRSSVEISSQGG